MLNYSNSEHLGEIWNPWNSSASLKENFLKLDVPSHEEPWSCWWWKRTTQGILAKKWVLKCYLKQKKKGGKKGKEIYWISSSYVLASPFNHQIFQFIDCWAPIFSLVSPTNSQVYKHDTLVASRYPDLVVYVSAEDAKIVNTDWSILICFQWNWSFFPFLVLDC